MTNTDTPEPMFPLARELTEQELLYKELGRELEKGGLVYLRDLLQKYSTITVALVAGSLTLLREDSMAAVFRLTVTGCFLFSLTCCLFGMLPTSQASNFGIPDSIQEGVRRATTFKKRCLFLSFGSLFIGFFAAFVGMADRLVKCPWHN